jgi:phosphatidylserine/phosphatidylglycerophosphate/cardiolipin synthase-like enzyme
MTRKFTRRSASDSSRSPTLIIVLLLVLLAASGYYLLTGSDPLGVFGAGGERNGPVIAAGTPEDWWRVYFTVPRDDADASNLQATVAEPLIERINAAQHSIHVAAFEFDLRPVADALISARQRGVEVRWITDDEYGIAADREEGAGLFPLLEQAGVQVRDDGRTGLMHDKFWIFDDQVLWTGSTNITANGVFRNNNNAIVFEVPEIAAIYEREFAEMWDGEFGVRSPSTVDDQTVLVKDSRVEVLFAPEDGVMARLVPLVREAKQSIRFMAFSFTDQQLGEAMLAAADSGLDVQGIFETRGSETEFSQMAPLFCGGVPVRQDGNPRTFHHKVLIIDGETVVTGSFNFTRSADEDNDENVVVITNQDIAKQYLAEFDRRWQESTPVDSNDVTCR